MTPDSGIENSSQELAWKFVPEAQADLPDPLAAVRLDVLDVEHSDPASLASCGTEGQAQVR